MIDLHSSIYGCSIILSIGKNISVSERYMRWNLWNQFRNNLNNYGDNTVENILRSTYPLEEYSENNLINQWGCNEDILSCNGDVIQHGDNIYSPIEINFYSYHNPPLKWCDYMGKRGFMVTCYFLNLDNETTTNKRCGKCIYDERRTFENKYEIPEINMNHLESLFMDHEKGEINFKRMREHTTQMFFKKGICPGLCELLDLYGVGPNEIAMKKYNYKNVIKKMELIDEQLQNGEINEGEYLELCNGLKDLYNGI